MQSDFVSSINGEKGLSVHETSFARLQQKRILIEFIDVSISVFTHLVFQLGQRARTPGGVSP
jgi:hypothetical protein